MTGSHLRLEARNLGPIEEANLELRPLTILIGKNNTGKTYLAQALYAAFKSIEEARPSLDVELSSDEIRSLRTSVIHAPDEENLVVPFEAHDKMFDWVRQTFRDAGVELKNRMLAYFSLPELKGLKRWDQGDAVSVDIFQDLGDGHKNFLFGLETDALPAIDKLSEVTIDSFENGLIDMAYFLGEVGNGGEDEDDSHRREFTWIMAREIWRKYLAALNLSGSAHYLPAGRSGLLTAWTDVVKLRLQLERDRFGLTSMPDTSLGGVALDFIAALSDILNRRRYKRRRYWQPELFRMHSQELPDSLRLLQELMSGGIFAGSGQDMVPILEYRQGEHKIPVQRASSMVADHAPLAMWMEHLLHPHDVLIIDEPESHLHPEAIRLVARVLVRLVNEDVNVVCATHSSVLLHEISNCILRSKLPKDRKAILGDSYSESDCIDERDVAVHRFVRTHGKEPAIVSRVDLDSEWGIPEDEYVEVAGDLSDESNRLFEELSL